MLIATMLAALTALAPAPNPWTCDLAPSVGSGTSDEGPISGMTSVNFGCRYSLVNLYGMSLSPSLGLDKQIWSVRNQDDGNNNMSTFETQDLNFGLRLDSMDFSGIRFFYAGAAAQGKGNLETTRSTSQTALSRNYGGLKHNAFVQSLGASYALTEKLALSLAWQRQEGRQSWSVDSGTALLQSVDDSNHLSLTDGSTALLGTEERSKSRSTANLLQFGVSMSFGG